MFSGYLRNFFVRNDKNFRLLVGSGFWSIIGFAAATIAVEFFVYTHAIANRLRVPVGEVDFIRVLVGYLYFICLVFSTIIYKLVIYQRYFYIRIRRNKIKLLIFTQIIVFMSGLAVGVAALSEKLPLLILKDVNVNIYIIAIALTFFIFFFYIVKSSQSKFKLLRTKFTFLLICLSFATTSAIMLQTILNHSLIGVIGYGDRQTIIIQWKNKDGDCFERTIGKFIFRSDNHIVFSDEKTPGFIYEMKMSLVCYVGYTRD